MPSQRHIDRTGARLAVLVLLFSAPHAPGRAAESGAAGGAAAWSASDIRVVETIPGKERTATTRFEIGENGDARISVEEQTGPAHTAGTILLIGGRWILIQGFAPSRRGVDALDVAALNSQLVIVLLTAVLPKGPPAAGPPQHVSFSEKNNPIRIATPTASGLYNAPWTVEGAVTVASAGAPATYRLTFTCASADHTRTTIFSGSVGSSPTPLRLPDSMRLAGWTIRRVDSPRAGPADAAHGEHTATRPKVATLGELRLE